MNNQEEPIIKLSEILTTQDFQEVVKKQFVFDENLDNERHEIIEVPRFN